MANLKRAHEELFRREPDEQFPDLPALIDHCSRDKEQSRDRWQLPQTLEPCVEDGALRLKVGTDGAFLMNDWSFSQLCRLAEVAKDTINRLSPETAARALAETLPAKGRPTQVLTEGRGVRSIHGTNYTRLWNVDLLSMVREFAVDFGPPPKAINGGTGLYCGEQDMFAFLIDAEGWAEIGGEAFAPGVFVWNSEVGRRTLGISTFWFQQVCQNHIVWDATEVVEFTAKHTSKVAESLSEMRRILGRLVERRDARREGFAKVIARAMEEKLGVEAEDVLKELGRNGIPQGIGRQAVKLIEGKGRFTIYALVDALTRLAREVPNAGDRTDLDQKAAGLLHLVEN
jgi:hypothetical protein